VNVSVLSLFSGIGLFDLGVFAALEEAGFSPTLAAGNAVTPQQALAAMRWA